MNFYRNYDLKQLLPDVTEKVILDIPCSVGNESLKFLEMGAKYIIGSDIVEEQLVYMKQRF